MMIQSRQFTPFQGFYRELPMFWAKPPPGVLRSCNYWFFQVIAHRPDTSISSSLFLLPQSVRQKSSLSVCTVKWERLVKCGSQGSLKEMWDPRQQGPEQSSSSGIPGSRQWGQESWVQNSHSWIPGTSHLQTHILHNLPGHLSLIFLRVTLW